jgi:prolyl 4-hydroxylase
VLHIIHSPISGEHQSVSKSRTSCTTWLRDDTCEIPVKTLRKRVTRLSGIPAENGENLQVVQYKGNGEKFDTHCDHLDSFNNLECRGRLATCLLYLNSARDSRKNFSDEGFIGGSTFFPEFDVGVTPKQGTAVFWFNTIERSGFNENNEEVYLNVDIRSRHSGEPVTENEKWVCNFWLHPIAIR